MKINVQEYSPQSERWPLWQTGFRPFFLGASLWAIVAMLIWFGVLRLGWQFPFNGLTATIWHGHEMLYGFSVAVIAGFLLTAVPNWTETKPIGGLPLVFVFASWLGARVTGLIGGAEVLVVTACLDLLFLSGLLVCAALPIVRGKHWKQSGILAKVILLIIGNAAYYLGASGHLENGIVLGLNIGFYLVIALVLTLGRRLIPFFIERRLKLSQPVRNDKWVDRASIILFLVFWALQVFTHQTLWIQTIALLLFYLHSFRLYHWHRPGIWADPLLWVLFVSYGFIVLSFALVAAPLFGVNYSPFLALHLFAVGGIGLITCGMMARISLGHSGRDLRAPPRMISIAFVSIALAAIVRVFLPMYFIEHYLLWLTISQWLWIGGFAVFFLNYMTILLSPRIDGKPG